MVWAQTPGGTIASNGELPWDVPEDFAHFRATVLGHPVIAGRTTWESMPPAWRANRARSGTRSVVLTRELVPRDDGVETAASLPDAVARLASDPDPERWVMGGGQVYALGMAVADLLVVSDIDVPEPDGFLTPAPVVDTDVWLEETPADVAGWRTSRTGTRWRIRHLRRA